MYQVLPKLEIYIWQQAKPLPHRQKYVLFEICEEKLPLLQLGRLYTARLPETGLEVVEWWLQPRRVSPSVTGTVSAMSCSLQQGGMHVHVPVLEEKAVLPEHQSDAQGMRRSCLADLSQHGSRQSSHAACLPVCVKMNLVRQLSN